MAAEAPAPETVRLSTLAAVGTSVAVTLHALLFLGVAYLCAWTVPRFKEMFADMRIELPVLTQFLLRVSDWFVDFWFVAFPGVFVLLAIDGVVFWLLVRRRGTWVLGILWFLAVTVATVLAIGFFVVLPLFLPLFALMQDIGHGG